MGYDNLINLIRESERVTTTLKLGYDSPETFTNYEKYPYASAGMDGAEDEESLDHYSGTPEDYIDSKSRCGYYSLKRKEAYWPRELSEQRLPMAAHGPIIGSIAQANNIKPESVEKLYDMVRLLRNGDVVHIEATHRKLSGFDEHHILSNFSELTPRFYYQSSELPKASVDYLAKLYPDMYHSGD